MNVNISKSINNVRNAYLKTSDKTSKNWKIVIKYTSPSGKIREWSSAFKLNKLPFVKDGKAILGMYKERLQYALSLVDTLNIKIANNLFDTAEGDFDVEKIDSPFKDFLNDWLRYKSTEVKGQSYEIYNNKINVIKDYLQQTNREEITLRDFNTYNEINSLLKWVKEKNGDSKPTYNYYLGIIKDVFKHITNVDGTLHPTQLITHKFSNYKIGRTSKNLAYRDVDKAIEILSKYNQNLGLLGKTIYYTLHRIDSIVQLQFKDFDLVNNLIYINKDIIKTGNPVTIRIHKNLLPIITEYVNTHTVNADDYFFGSIDNSNGFKSVRLFAPHPTKKRLFSDNFRHFKVHKDTDRTIFTTGHTLYSFKHSGVNYYKKYFTDNVIIKITGHKDESILKTYSKDFEAIIDEDLFNLLP